MNITRNDSSRREATMRITPVSGRRGGNDAVISRPNIYDYVPSVLLDGTYRIWWGGGGAGDLIFYSESASLDGPWSAGRIVFEPTRALSSFDYDLTCDPCVIRVDGWYYLYYAGNNSLVFRSPTRIGLASSRDGITWTRENGGLPIICPHGNIDNATPDRRYGAGQPTVVYLDDKFYLMYTDSTGANTNSQGGGQYVLRSSDPTFQTDVWELTERGFVFRGGPENITTQYSPKRVVSADLAFVDLLDCFVMAICGTAGEISLAFFDRDFTELFTETMPDSPWTEGPGIVCRPDRHLVPHREHGSSNLLPIDIFRSVGSENVNTWDLAFVGYDYETNLPEDVLTQRYSKLYEGSCLQCEGLPFAFILRDLRLQIERTELVTLLTTNFFNVNETVYRAVTKGGDLNAGCILHQDENVAAFVTPPSAENPERYWPISSWDLMTANLSSNPETAPMPRDQGGSLYKIDWRPAILITPSQVLILQEGVLSSNIAQNKRTSVLKSKT